MSDTEENPPPRSIQPQAPLSFETTEKFKKLCKGDRDALVESLSADMSVLSVEVKEERAALKERVKRESFKHPQPSHPDAITPGSTVRIKVDAVSMPRSVSSRHQTCEVEVVSADAGFRETLVPAHL